MVCTDTHRDIDIVLLLADLTLFKSGVFQTCNLLLSLDDRLEDVRIVVGVLALHHTDETLKAHTCVNDIHRELLQRTVGLAIELHKHEVPDLNHLRIILIHQFTTTLA